MGGEEGGIFMWINAKLEKGASQCVCQSERVSVILGNDEAAKE